MKYSNKQLFSIIFECLVKTFFMVFISGTLFAQTTPITMSLQAQLAADGPLNGKYKLEVSLMEERLDSDEKPKRNWGQVFPKQDFVDGVFSVVLGTEQTNALKAEYFTKDENIARYFRLVVDGSEVEFPIPSSPYAIQARLAESVIRVNANTISGDFTNPLILKNDLIVEDNKGDKLLNVDYSTARVGIATDNTGTDSDYALNVNGVLNASNFKVNNQNIESLLSWKKRDDILYYSEGNVAVGTDNTTYALEVIGTVNASEYRIKGVKLEDALGEKLTWKAKSRSGSTDIYYGDEDSTGKVGIGTSEPKSKLDVDGGVKIGVFSGINPVKGTIQYDGEDFRGYNGSNWVSFTGLSGNGKNGQLAFWEDKKLIKGISHVRWDDSTGRLGVGLNEGDKPRSILDVRARKDDVDLMHIRSSAGFSAFKIKNSDDCVTGYCVGIGKESPAFSLDVNGIINAQEIYIGGAPLSTALSTGTFWFQGRGKDVYYDIGHVGIGTSEPRSTLEIASKEDDAVITFDIDGKDLFSMGIENEDPDAFIISKGGDLSVPVFSFKGDRIGVGLSEPKANLHVSGNTGLLISGEFAPDSGVALPMSGEGTRLMWVPKKAAFRVGQVLEDYWDDDNIGEHSVAMGYNPLAKGDFSMVGGGYMNEATGKGAVVPGGFNNEAKGAFSFAAGHQAVAKHSGTFVWSDYTPSAPVKLEGDLIALYEDAKFTSKGPNQFLIKAQNGVGIGTSDTKGSVLTLKKQVLENDFIKFLDNDNKPIFVLNASGNIAIGSDDPGTAKLYIVSGSVAVGTKKPRATIDIVSDSSGTLAQRLTNLIFSIRSETETSAMLVNENGNIAIGFDVEDIDDPLRNFFTEPLPGEKIPALQINGDMLAEAIFVKTEDGNFTKLDPRPGSPWSKGNDNSIFYSMGNVGIGTESPSSLLELSNSSNTKAEPAITFDVDKIDRYTLGVTLNRVAGVRGDETLFIISEGGKNTTTPSIVISTQNVGIGRGLELPRFSLDVNGNTYISGNVFVCKVSADTPNCNSTEELNKDYSLNVVGKLRASKIFENEEELIILPSPWCTADKGVDSDDTTSESCLKKDSDGNVYTYEVSGLYTTRNVSVGTDVFYPNSNLSDPNKDDIVRLNVNGSISANNLILSNDELDLIKLNDGLSLNQLKLKDQNPEVGAARDHGRLLVKSNELLWCPPNVADPNNCTALSSSLIKAINPDGSGPLSFFITPEGVADSLNTLSLGESGILWHGKDDEPKKLEIQGELGVERYIRRKGLKVTSNISLGSENGYSIRAELNHDGDLSAVEGYVAQEVAINIGQNWGSPDQSLIEVVGMDINIETTESKLLNNARAVGLKVDLTDVNTSEGGQKYAAIFKGGNVGIGTSLPSVDLEVNGTVSANEFNLSGTLEVPALKVRKNADSTYALIADSKLEAGSSKPRVGIGVENPLVGNAELWVNGLVSASALVVDGGIKSQTLNIQNDNDPPVFFINDDGNIGFGTNDPKGQIEISQVLDNTVSDPFTSQKIDISIDGAAPNSTFYFPEDITGMHVKLSSDQVNKISSTVTGVSINMSDIEATDPSLIHGLDIDVSGDTGTRYAATFMGGNVGIGTRTPSYNLHVSGNIYAKSLELTESIETERATFNYLVVNTGASFNGTVTINELDVAGTLHVRELEIGTHFSAPLGNISTLNVERLASFNNLVEAQNVSVNTLLQAATAQLDAVAIGGADMPVSGLRVSGNVLVENMTILNGLEIGSTAQLNVNDEALFVPNGVDKFVGINTKDPKKLLHINGKSTSEYDVAINNSWGTIAIQNNADGADVASGILLVPHINSDAAIGSGIAAIKVSDAEENAGSHLVFITDPIASDPKERMRIMAEGNIGIGTETPTSLLHVNGELGVSGNLIVDNQLIVTKIEAKKDLHITPNGIMFVHGTISSNMDVQVGNGLYFEKTSTPTDIAPHGRLFVDEDDSDLYYLKPGLTTPTNISKAFTGDPSRLAYFNSSGTIDDEAALFWNDSTKTFMIGEGDVFPSLVVSTNYKANIADKTTNILEKIRLTFEDRSTYIASDDPETSTFIGLDIEFDSDNPDDPNNFGRLGQDETAIGLKVDMRELKVKQSNKTNGAILRGSKYAAAFLGGSVGVGTKEPSAALHIKGEVVGNDALRVDVRNTENVLLVADSGFVGVGTGTPTAKLHVKGDSASIDLFQVQNSNDDSIIVVKNDGKIGIGDVPNPSVELEVKGTISANITEFGSITGTTLNIVGLDGSSHLFVDATGNIGIGTDTPKENFSFFKSITNENEATIPDQFISEKLTIHLGKESPSQHFFFNKNMTGLDIKINSKLFSYFGSDTLGDPNVFATGVSINMSGLNMQDNATATGVFVDVSKPAGNNDGTRYAAIFMGGKVGIGTDIPEEDLHVNGTIRARDLILSGTIDASAASATFNQLTINGDASIAGDVTANKLFAETASINNLVVDGSMSFFGASFTTINVQEHATINRLAIGHSGALSFSGDEVLKVSGNVVITGDVTVDGVFIVNTIETLNNGDDDLTITSGEVIIKGDVSTNQSVKVGKGLYFSKVDTSKFTTTEAELGAILVDNDGQLVYRKPNDNTFSNLSYTGGVNRIPYFNATGKLSSDAPLEWNPTTEALEIQSRFSTTATYNNAINQSVSLQKLEMKIGDRSAATSETQFTALDINFASLNDASKNDFGRLGDGETGIGLMVDVRDVFRQQTVGGKTLQATKNAAIFMGGNVGIGTRTPEAGLHIAGEVVGNKALRVDVRDKENVLVVAGDGFVGVGTSAPSAKFHIKSQDDNNKIFIVENKDNSEIFSVNKVGIMEVSGTINATTISGDLLTGKKLNIGNNDFVVTDNGKVGFGTDNPTGHFSFFKKIDNNTPNEPVISQKIQVELGSATEDQEFYFDQDITGLDITLSSEANNFLGDGAESTANGLIVDFTDLELEAVDNIAIGVFVDVTKPAGDEGERIAAIFNGGKVGIGTLRPGAALDVVGDLAVSNKLTIKGELIADDVTFNSLVVEKKASFNAGVSVNNLIAKTLDVEHLKVNETLVGTGTLKIATLNLTATATIRNMVVEGIATFNEGLVVNKELSVSTINAAQNIDIVPGVGNEVVFKDKLNIATTLNIKDVFVFQNKLLTPPTITDVQAALYIDKDGELIYQPPGLVDGSVKSVPSVNISGSLTGKVGNIPFVTLKGLNSEDSPLNWNNDTQTFEIKKPDHVVQLKIENTISDEHDTDFDAQVISINVATREDLVDGKQITAFKVGFDTDGNESRLADGDLLTGIVVDVRNVNAEYSGSETLLGDGIRKRGYKSAATFMGGSVGIGEEDPLKIMAALHVKSEDNTTDPFRVDSFSTPNILVASKKGFVGIGTGDPNSVLHIKQKNSNQTLLTVADTGNQSVFRINKDGAVQLFDAFDVAAPVADAEAYFHLDKENTDKNIFKISSDKFELVVSENGFIGVGFKKAQESKIAANLHISQHDDVDLEKDLFKVSLKNIDDSGAAIPSLVVNNEGQVGIGNISDPQYALQVNGIVAIGTPNAGESFINTPRFIQDDADNSERGFLVNSATKNIYLGTKDNEGILYSAQDLQFLTYDNKGATLSPAMTIIGSGVSQNFVGIGTAIPNAQLHVKSNTDDVNAFQVDGKDTVGVLTVSTSSVGIGTKTPSSSVKLHVKGKASFDHLIIDNGELVVTTLNVQDQLKISRVVENNFKNETIQGVSINIDADIAQDLIGLNINMQSNDHSDYADDGRKYVLYDNAVAYGIKVDMSGLEIGDSLLQKEDPVVAGKKYAGLFKGGNVGIGTETPEFPLHVVQESTAPFGNDHFDIARFGSKTSDLTFRAETEPGHMSFVLRRAGDATEYMPMTLAGVPSGSGANDHRVGIGTSRPSEALQVAGDIRVGITQQTEIGADTDVSNGNKLIFSGAGDTSSTAKFDSENSDPLWIARRNDGEDKSALRVNIGDDGGKEDRFQVGYEESNNYKDVLNVHMNRRVGISDGDTPFEPETTLHIRANKVGSSQLISDHVMLIENVANTEADSLAIRHSANWGATPLTEHSHFIDFFGGTNLIGFIGANGVKSNGKAAGVRYVSQGADYAEYLEKVRKSVEVEKGDIMGVINGKISHSTKGAQLLMVKSSGASVAGNYPGEHKLDEYALMAFFGQVPIKVRGKIKKGDFIIPSGKHDGVGIAISPKDAQDYPLHLIVGRAWESSRKRDVKLIHSAVGFNFNLPSMQEKLAKVGELSKEMDEIKKKDEKMTEDFESKLAEQNREIEDLLKKVEALESK